MSEQPRPTIRVAQTGGELFRHAAEIFARAAEASCAGRGSFAVALAGGSTPEKLYRMLADEGGPYRARIPWRKIEWFWGDERHVPPDHADSNYRMAREAMLSKVPVADGAVHRIPAEMPDAAEAAESYAGEIRSVLAPGAGALPRFDLILLGMGPDGHTASLFPGTDAVRETKRWVAAPWVEKLATHRITLTPPVINNAARVLFMVTGAGKAETLRDVLEGPPDPDRLPSQVVRPENGELIWLLDRESASKLSRS